MNTLDETASASKREATSYRLYPFSNGLYLANLAVSSNILIDSWNAIFGHIGDNPGTIIKHHLDYNIIALVGSPVTTSYLEEKSGSVLISKSDFQFLLSDTHPSFSINEAAFTLFNSLQGKFPGLREEVKSSFKPVASISSAEKNEKKEPIPYIITGHCLNGSIASLLTLSLLNTLDRTKYKLPLCITFGSPLLGNTAFQQAVSCHPTWNSCFLHVVHKDDHVPRLSLGPPAAGQSSHKPFGTFLLYSESGWACFQAPDSVIELLPYKGPGMDSEDQESRTFDYEEFIKRLERMPFPSNGSSFLGHEADSFIAGITAQVTAVGLWQSRVTHLDYVYVRFEPLVLAGVLSGEIVIPF